MFGEAWSPMSVPDLAPDDDDDDDFYYYLFRSFCCFVILTEPFTKGSTIYMSN